MYRLTFCVLLLCACGDDSAADAADGGADASEDADSALDAGADEGGLPSTEHCEYRALEPTARAGSTVRSGPLEAGTASLPLRIPVGIALGAYTARTIFFGGGGAIDERPPSGLFSPSVGVETRPLVKALALKAGDETVVILKADLGVAADDLLFDLEARLGPSFAGKVLISTSHSHSAFGQHTPNSVLELAFGLRDPVSYRRILDDFEEAARTALERLEPAALAIGHAADFDPIDAITRDRRSENDALAGGRQKDSDLFVLRVDAADGRALALVPIFGLHGTALDSDNNLASTDVTGAIEWALEETLPADVLVMHLQGVAGDVSPVGSGDIVCEGDDPCYRFANLESVGQLARAPIRALYDSLAEELAREVPIEMLTRTIPLGPDWTTFSVRGGDLRYAPFDGTRLPDGELFAPDGEIRSPIDEFNAPFGAAFCGTDGSGALGAIGALPGVSGLAPYSSCTNLRDGFESLSLVAPEAFGPAPVCGTTQTTISALRIGETLFAAVPGEPVTLFADALRAASPAPPEQTVVLGYAQAHIGYLMTVEDWMAGGFESSINAWGPLEGEYILEESARLLGLAWTDAREDGTAGGAPRFVPRTGEARVPMASPNAGTIPDPVPNEVFVRARPPLMGAQPEAVRRLESAYFVWIGEDPVAGTPRVRLQHEVDGEFTDVLRPSGRPLVDRDFLLTHTPLPLSGEDATFYWAVEWQAAGDGPLETRLGVPAGRYRFAVEGAGYAITSTPFDVLPRDLRVDAREEGGATILQVGTDAVDGYRLLHPALPSNGALPLFERSVRVRIDGEAPVELALDGMGEARVAGVGHVSFAVEDAFGNEGLWER